MEHLDIGPYLDTKGRSKGMNSSFSDGRANAQLGKSLKQQFIMWGLMKQWIMDNNGFEIE